MDDGSKYNFIIDKDATSTTSSLNVDQPSWISEHKLHAEPKIPNLKVSWTSCIKKWATMAFLIIGLVMIAKAFFYSSH